MCSDRIRIANLAYGGRCDDENVRNAVYLQCIFRPNSISFKGASNNSYSV